MRVAAGATDVTTYFKLVDASAGTPKTGITITDLDLSYVRDRAAISKTDATALAAVDSAHGDNKAIEIDATNAPGLYRVDWPDAAFAAGVDRVQLVVIDGGSQTIDPAVIEVEIGPIPADVVQLGGVTQSATDLKDFADAGYDPATNKVEGVKTVDTTTTNSDMRGTDGAYTGTPPTAGAIADQVWEEAIADHATGTTFGGKNQKAVPSETLNDYKADVTNLDAAVSSRSSHSAADVWTSGTRTLTSFGTLVSDIWSNGTRTLTGFSTALALAVWDVLESAVLTASSMGLKLKTNLDALVSSRAPESGGNVAAIKAKTDNLPASPAAVGSAMTLADDAVTAAKFDETTAFPLKSADTGSTQVARVGADGDTLETLSDQIDLAALEATVAGLNDISVADILAGVVEGTLTFQQVLRVMLSVLAGKSTGGGSPTQTFRDVADSKNRISGTVDANGNRTAVTLDGS